MEKPNRELVTNLNSKMSNSSPEEVLEFLVGSYGPRLLTSSTFSPESQVLTHMLLGATPRPRIFFLDSGRMFQEVFEAMEETRKRFAIPIEYIFPDKLAVEKMVSEKGPNLFFESVENRELCCKIRKVDPLVPVLQTCDVWISGLRREQSQSRNSISLFEFDDANQIMKAYPLYNWPIGKVWEYVKMHQLPYNKLFDHGYQSVGCAPCTRAIRPGEDIRSGRWWWEDLTDKECGIHWVDGRLVRKR